MLSTSEHAAIKRQTQQQRNQAARGRRAGQGVRPLAAVCVPVTINQENVLFLVPQADPTRAYVLRLAPDGRWRCGCFTSQWNVGRTCAHEAAAARWQADH